jgi:DNA repair exonuclease SbcCD ATPase subunit
MILIKDLTVKNFMSVGNQTQAVNFNNKQLTLVLGENLDQGGDDSGSRNGTGKTTIINALSYALYGVALTNIKRNNLINKTNGKGMLVTLNFEKAGVNYRIERGRGPNLLKFFIDDTEQDIEDMSQGDSRKTQADIGELLQMSHTMFKHLVALNTYTEPFLSLKANDQREIIEQLLGITILSEKAEELKVKQKEIRDAITEETARINAIQTSNDKIGETINSLQIKSTAWKTQNAKDCERLQTGIDELEHLDIEQELSNHELLSKWEETDASRRNLTKEKATLESALSQTDKQVAKASGELEHIDEAKCHACGQDLPEEKIDEIQKKLEEEYADTMSYLMEIDTKFQKVQAKLADLGEEQTKPNTFYETAKEAYEHRSNVDNLKSALGAKETETDPYVDQIDELNNSAIQEVDWNSVNDLNSMKEHQDFLYKLLTNKDSFIRKKIIEQNLAYLNNRLTNYLDKIGLPHSVVFQNDLTVLITQLGQDLDFDNLSRGERNRLILGMSFAFRDVWESLYQNINLMFIDELIDSGMDTAGVEQSLAILKKMGRERKKNIYLISHKDELQGRVQNVLKVVKENGFTSYANDIDIVQ